MGLPGKRDEYWRYTDPTSLTTAAPQAAALFDASDEAPHFDAIDRVKLVFVDGVFAPDLSDDPAVAGVELLSAGTAGWQAAEDWRDGWPACADL